MPPPECLYLSADCYEIWYRRKTSHDLKDSTIKIYQGHHVGAHFHKMWPNIRKHDIICFGILWKSLMFEAIIIILQVLMISMRDISYLWWLRKTCHNVNEDIYCKFWSKHSVKLQFTTWKSLLNTRWRQTYFINDSIFLYKTGKNGNDENTLFWSQFKFRITFQVQFLEWNIVFLFYLWFL